MEYIAGTRRNPFGFDPPCEAFVPGYGVTTADFHVAGDHPGVHGGRTTGIPFTDEQWSPAFFDALQRGGLFDEVDLEAGSIESSRTFLSYLHLCDPGESTPGADDYAAMEPFFDAEVRAITADVLLPVGSQATAHVLGTYTARDGTDIEMSTLHGTEIRGSGWLVVPLKDPAAWTGDDAEQLVESLRSLLQTDYRRVADLGRFSPDEDPYFVR